MEVIRLTTETLSGIPSIVYGLFGMLFFVNALGWGFSLLAGAFTLSIMILPLIMRTTEEALKAVPDSYREGSFGLGAGKLRTVFRIVLPSAVPGILAGIIPGDRAYRGRDGGPHLHGRHRGPGSVQRVRLRPNPGRTHVQSVQRGSLHGSGLRHGSHPARPRGGHQRAVRRDRKKTDESIGKGMEMSKISIRNLDLYYSDFKALKNVNLEIEANKITAFIGPSGCGKSTLLKSINRMNDLVEGCRIEGTIELDGQNIFKGMDVNMLRKRVGMVFQKPNPFPMSIYDNIAYGPRTHGVHSKAKLDDIVEKSLRNAAIWDECKDRLKSSALGMSGGQQQRLCIARALAVEPEVLLMDEPTSALDPISTSKIEDLAMELKKDYTIVMVTHNMQQAVRVSDHTAFFLLGEVIEYNDTEKLFSIPSDKRTEDYITGRFG